MKRSIEKRALTVLRRIKGRGKYLSATEVAYRLKASPASVSSALCKLWKAGDVGRYPGQGDTARAMGYFV